MEVTLLYILAWTPACLVVLTVAAFYGIARLVLRSGLAPLAMRERGPEAKANIN